MFDKSNFKDIYSLSPMQQGMLFHTIMDNTSSAYFEQGRLTINGKIDISLFEKSFNFIIEKYDILRTVFLYEKVSQPVQIVLRKRTGNILYKDVSDFKEEERKSYIEDFARKDKMQGFELSKELPMRIVVIKTNEEEHEVIWSYHHIIMDGWCLGTIIGDFFKAYSLLGKGKEISTVDNHPYSDYIKWLKRQNKEEALVYWKDYLQDYEQQASVPILYKKTNESIYLECETQFEINEAITEKLISLARENQISLNVILQTVWGILLQKYNNTKDAVFGVVVSGRPSEVIGIESMVGLFINTIPVRIKENNESFIELSKEIQKNASKSMAYDYMPLADVQANTILKNNLFDHIIVFENYPLDKLVKSIDSNQELGFSLQGFEMFEHTNYDFNLAIMPGETILLKSLYNGSIYNKEQIGQIFHHFNMIINQVVENPEITASSIDIIDNEERSKLLMEFNNTKAEYPKNKTIQQLFEEQAEKTPDKIAVVYKEKQLTYKELNQKSNIIARILRNKGVKADDAVAILIDKSIEMIIGVMAILKAGGAYLPIDIDYPTDRIEYILKDSGSKILLTQADIANTVNFEGHKLILDNQEIYNTSAIDCNDNLEIINKANSLAYIMYTSGSTGKPKGVMVEHKNVVRLVKNTNYISFNEEDKILQTGALVFDASTFEIWGALLNGLPLYLFDKSVILDADKLAKAIE
ncbi:MAG: condensation domain-containing protein, partial [Lutisporaceae bacterium]